MTGYVICATPRSGSTLLCALLRASGVAGWPESWFRAVDRSQYARDWGILQAGGRYAEADYLRAMQQAARRGGPVFGLRLMYDTLGEMVAALGGASPHRQADLLQRHLGPLHFLHLTREDKLGQAISRYRAEVSGTWHLGFEEAADPRPVVYDAAAIATWLAATEAADRSWNAWFAVNGVTPWRISYADLAAAPEATARAVLAHLGLAVPPGQSLAVGNRKMADAETAAWARQFRVDMARRDG